MGTNPEGAASARALELLEVWGLQKHTGLLALIFPALRGGQLEQHLGSIQEEVLS